MEEWKEYIVSDLGRIVTGKTPRTSIPENYGGKIPFLTPSDDLSGKYSPKTIKTITDIGLNEVKNCLLPPKSICVSCIGSDLGKVVITEEPTVTNQQFNSIIPNDENDADYIYYLMTIVGKQLNFLSKTSTAVPIINKSTFSSFSIKLPSKKTQQQIASILSSLDDKIELNRRINENLEAQAQALFKSWFVDFEPFRDGEFVESELGMIPKGWRVGSLSDIAFINPARSIKKGDKATYLDMKNMPTSGPFPLLCETKEYTGGMRFQNQDTLLARITPCLENGKVAYVNFLEEKEIAFGSTEYIVMTTKDGFLPELLYFLCRDEYFKGYATKNMNGSSGRQRVSGETIGNYKIPLPPKSLLEPIAPYFKSVMDTIRNNGFESRRLATLRDTLLPRLMSGEIKVGDVTL